MKSVSWTRRNLLAAGGAAAATAGMARVMTRAANAQGTIRMRRNIESLSAPELQAYEHAIQITKDRSKANPDDPTGYQYWADLHDNFDDSIHSGCTHFSEKFFPWHRQYLADFEAVLQKTDPPVTAQVMIPYWDWTTKPKAGVHFPAAFERQASPLFDVRIMNKNPPPWDPADLRGMVQDPDWSLFAGKPDPSNGFGTNPGSVESGPHNTLHTNISADMRSPTRAVRDPIFWSFHAGIDLAWKRWQRLHVPAGKTQVFGDPDAIIWFRDRSFKVGVTANTADYHYDYEYDFSGDGPPAATVASLVAMAPGIAAPAKSTAKLDLAAAQGGAVTAQMAASAAIGPTAVLRLGDIRVFHDRSYRLNVYLLPKGSQPGPNYLMRTLTLWQSHHDVTVEVFVKPTKDQRANLAKGWVVTIQSEAVEEEGPAQPSGAPHAMAMATAGATLPTTAALIKTLELQER